MCVVVVRNRSVYSGEEVLDDDNGLTGSWRPISRLDA